MAADSGVILLRHTRPPGAEGLCYGRSDLPPGPDLLPEATRLAGELPPVARIVTSPLRRARELARQIGNHRTLVPQVDPRLAEMDFGRWEGRRWDDIARAELDAWAADLTGARPHGGETVAELLARVAAALDDLGRGAGPVLVVCHAGVIRAALAARQGPAGWQAQIGFGCWLRLGGAE